MIKLYVDDNNKSSLIRSHNSFKDKTFAEMSGVILDNLRIGTSFMVFNKNNKPELHRGNYYLLYLEEYKMVTLLYIDVSKELRIVYYGDINNAVYAIYRSVATGTMIKVLKSDNKKAYTVVNSKGEVVPFTVKSRDGELYEQVYLKIFEAINYAVRLHKENGGNYSVTTRKKNILV